MRRLGLLLFLFLLATACGEDAASAPKLQPVTPQPEGSGCGGDFCERGLTCHRGVCAKSCAGPGDCAIEQACDEGYCINFEPIPALKDNPLDKLWDVRCDAKLSMRPDARWEIAVEIPPDQEVVTIVALTRSGPVGLKAIVDPAGVERSPGAGIAVDERWDTRGLIGTYADISAHAVIQLPQRIEPRVALSAGTYTLYTDSSRPCAYVVAEPRSAAAQRIDLNVHLVADGLDVAEAERTGFIEARIAPIQDKLAAHGMALGEVRLIDAPTWMRQRYSYLRGELDHRELLSLGQHTPATRAESLAIDVFIVTDLLPGSFMGDAPAGVSGQLNGPPGLRGNGYTGVAVSLVKNSERDMPLTLIHELGHYMGLPHTTEIAGDADALSDTPVCADVNMLDLCPDADNIMFPYNLGRSGSAFSPQQAQQLLDNAHSQPAP